ncbi:MAG: hypothetical protein RMK84_02800 [Oscillochloridaceae bacterium]|nr:hypothetical protein [Chloroflexaceae bacterium]MDW8389030.1 hypothetical protein [Oscillochloridaceae bacterium]
MTVHPLILDMGFTGAASTMGLAATLFLIGVLVQREAISSLAHARAGRMRAALWVAIAPLVGVFALVVATRITAALAG